MKDLSIEIAKRLQGSGHIAVYAGGCVRDHLLGVEPKDYDIATSARPEQVINTFEKDFKVIPVGVSFGVIRIVKNDHQVEVATLRTEQGYSDGRRPDAVSFTKDLKEDAARRDFTINAMFMDPITGAIFDFFDGEADLANRVIRPVGNARVRFSEDFLRMMRAARFVAQLDAQLDPDIIQLMSEMSGNIKRVSPERRMDELAKMFRTRHAKQGIAILNITGILGQMFPITKLSYSRLQDCPSYASLEDGLAYLLQDLPKEDAEEVVKSSRCSSKIATDVFKQLSFIEHLDSGNHYQAYKDHKFLNRVPMIAYKRYSVLSEAMSHWPSVDRPRLVTGLLIQSVRPDIVGVAMGDAISKGARAQYDGVISNIQEATEWLKSL